MRGLESGEPFNRRQAEIVGQQRLVNVVGERGVEQNESPSSRTQHLVEPGDSRVCAWPLELGYRRLCDAKPAT